MKICPACLTQYSDDTLRYCLQDGTVLKPFEPPATTAGETETFVRPRVTPGTPQSEVTRVLPVPVQRQEANTALTVVLTAVGMLVLFAAIGAAAFIVWTNSPEPTNITANVVTPGNQKAPPLPTPAKSSQPPKADEPTLPVTDDSASRAEIEQSIYGWKSALESRDLNSYMGNYAARVDYFNRRGLSSAAVRADKARAFDLYDSMRVNISNIETTISGDTATTTFDKEWAFGGRSTSSGKVRSQLTYRRIGGRWLITGERDIRNYNSR